MMGWQGGWEEVGKEDDTVCQSQSQSQSLCLCMRDQALRDSGPVQYGK